MKKNQESIRTDYDQFLCQKFEVIKMQKVKIINLLYKYLVAFFGSVYTEKTIFEFLENFESNLDIIL